MNGDELRLTTASVEATEALAARLSAGLRPGDLVALDGPLGAGKTAFVRGLAAGLGVDATVVKSPTFVLHHVYGSPPRLHHLDLYRLGPGARIELLDLDTLLESAPAGSGLEYVCVIAYVDPVNGVERLFEGRCSGSLDPRPRGERGFGYDPAFLPDGGPQGLTMAELTDEQKDAISHRGIAARALRDWLAAGAPERG